MQGGQCVNISCLCEESFLAAASIAATHFCSPLKSFLFNGQPSSFVDFWRSPQHSSQKASLRVQMIRTSFRPLFPYHGRTGASDTVID